MRGTIEGKKDVILDTAGDANPAEQPAFEVNPGGSNTLQSRNSESTEALRASFIEAMVRALADGSAPRLAQSRSWV
jgi:hypothetical protein